MGQKKSRNRVHGGHIGVTGIIHIAAVGISLGVLGVELCLISEGAEYVTRVERRGGGGGGGMM